MTLFREEPKDGEPFITMKLGTYRTQGGRTLFNHPIANPVRCEVKILGGDFDRFVSFLAENVDALRVGHRRYIAVDGNETAELLERMAERFKGKDARVVASAMLEHGLLPEDVLLAALHKDRVRAIEEAERMLEEDLVEQAWQVWFQHNDWVMGNAHVAVLDERRIDPRNFSDYLVKSEDGHMDVVEIKRPGLPFWTDRKDHENLVPHPKLTAAITQAQAYLYELEREMDSRKSAERFNGCPIACPRATLIHGRSLGWAEEHLRSQRLLNGGLARIQVLTYDQVLSRARRILGASAD